MSKLYFHAHSGSHIREGIPFTINDFQYPSNWLTLSTPEDKLAIGLEEVITVGERKDDRYYWLSESLEGAKLTYTNRPKDLGPLKEAANAQAKATANAKLIPSDWMVIRKMERGIEIPAEVSAYRAAVIQAENDAVVAYEAASSVDDLIAVVVDWPEEAASIRKKDNAGAKG